MSFGSGIPRLVRSLFVSLSCLCAVSACGTDARTKPLASAPVASPSASAALPRSTKVMLGVDTLASGGFAQLKGKRVGLLTHPAGVNRDGRSTIDVLRSAPGVRLVALYGPEHGIYGDEAANVPVANRTDKRTGLPVYSLYGTYRKPTPAMIKGIDVMVVDLQDLGVRSYTYVSCLRKVMEACFEAGKEVVVLDRPNPLGGLKVDGPSREAAFDSYVGAYPVPYVHGLTIGELARMAKATPGWLDAKPDVVRRGRLTVVPMQGWRRSMLWSNTGLRWIPTSPGIPNEAAAFGYAMTGLGTQIGGFSHGYGTPYSFRLIVHNRRTPEQVKAAFDALRIPGLSFQIMETKNSSGRPLRGNFVRITDWGRMRPTELSFHMMNLSAQWDGNPFKRAGVTDVDLFNKHTGEGFVLRDLRANGRLDMVGCLARWKASCQAFQGRSRPYWLYD